MKVTVEEISPIKKKLSIEISNEEFKDEIEKAYQKLAQKVSIKGFRKGHVPRSILEQYYKDQTESDVFTHLIEESYVKALREQNIEPVGAPRISDLKKEDSQPITYSAEVDVRPAVQLKKYKEVPLKKPPVEVTDDEVGKEMEALRHAHAQITPLPEETPLQTGHIAIVDFVGRLGEKPFEGGEGKGVMIEVGMGRFLKDFEEGLAGMKKGQTKKVSVNFPKDYPSPELAGQKADFEITLNDLKEKILPELNDDFARDLGNFESLDQIKQRIRENMQNHKEHAARGELFKQLIDFLIEEHPLEVPDSMVEQELEAMFENTRRHLQQQKLTPEQAGITPEGFRTQNREAALKRIKGLLIFETIAKAENIQVTPEELGARVQNIAQSVGQKVEAVHQYYRERNLFPFLVTQVLEEKVLDFLISQAKVK